MTLKLAVSIINFRTRDLTLACLRSVMQDMAGLDGEIVVIDNRSDDGSAEAIADWIAALPPGGVPVRLIRSATNSGFSGGHNQGISAVRADYYLILNSDAVLRPGFFREILSVAEAQPQAGLIAPTIETESGEVQVSQFRFHSPLSELNRGAQSGPVTRLLRRHVVALTPPADPARIEWASFACILLNGRMIERIGPMDDGYFLYFEDAEYCLRARRAGWGIAQAPRAAVVHHVGGSGTVMQDQRRRKRLPRYYYCARARFFCQAHGRTGLLLANLAWHLGRGLAWLRPLAGQGVPRAVEAEARDIWTGFLSPLRGCRGPDA